MAREAGTPYLCVINDAEPAWKTTHSAKDYLLAADVPVADTIVAHRQAYLAAMSMGKSGPEIDKPDKKNKVKLAEKEIDDLWEEMKTALKKKGARHGRG